MWDRAPRRWATGNRNFETAMWSHLRRSTDKALTDGAESVRRPETSCCIFISHIFGMYYFITKLQFLIEVTTFLKRNISLHK